MARGIAKAIAGILTVVIGGTAYAVSQKDVVKNFSNETGLTQQEAQQYVESIPEDELASFDELGAGHIVGGQDILDAAADLDCVNYQYEWQTDTLSCDEGYAQLMEFGQSSVELGETLKILGSESATPKDIIEAIRLIDRNNLSVDSEIMVMLLGESGVDEYIKSNLYNKAILKTALESD